MISHPAKNCSMLELQNVNGCIPGATKIGSYWDIPADAEKPNDKRIKSGKYIKKSDIMDRMLLLRL